MTAPTPFPCAGHRALWSPTRREFVYSLGASLGSVAFSAMMAQENLKSSGPLAPKDGHVPAKAKRCIFLMMEGGPSHIDTFDPKPALAKLHLKEFVREGKQQSAMSSGKRYYVQSPFAFRKAGQSGADMCELWENLQRCVDDICFYRGCQVDSVNHPTAMYQMNCGNRFGGDPAIGSWVTYGLGSVNQDLPGFIVLPEVSYPQGGSANWSNGFLPAKFQEMYGIGTDATDAFGRKCLLARRLVEKGVRFVQLYAGTWDSHDYIGRAHANLIRNVDQPIAALLADLKQRGLLDSTLVIWCGEFGRSPDNGVRGGTAYGRDHNPKAMTIWMAGGGVKAGHVIGATDETGAEAVDCVHHVRDLHVTLLHLLGLDDNKLTYFNGGRFKQLSQFGGSVIKELIA